MGFVAFAYDLLYHRNGGMSIGGKREENGNLAAFLSKIYRLEIA